MKLPGQIQAEYTLKGIWFAVIAAVVLASLGFGAYQYTMRHGFHLLFFKYEGDLAKIERLEGEIGAIIIGQKEAERLQKAVNDARQASYDDIAERIEDENSTAQSDALDAATRYIAANRLRPQSSCAPGGSRAPTDGNGSAVSPSVPDDSFVAVTDADVRACSAAAAYAVKAHDWAKSLKAADQ